MNDFVLINSLGRSSATEDDYVNMQKRFYEDETRRMAVENHGMHNSNPDYWNVLLGPLNEGDWSDKVALDFACGTGRNVENMLNRFNLREVHGCDISSNNIQYCENTMEGLTNKTNFKFVTSDGKSLRPLESNTYDFIMSTIALQHICVYTVRRSILEDMFRCLRPGGMVSIQMGFGPGHPRTSEYYENATHAQSTNSGYDVRVDDPSQIEKDLLEIGFENFEYDLKNKWHDSHSQWIYFRATKPVE